jgi:hypothetical protein
LSTTPSRIGTAMSFSTLTFAIAGTPCEKALVARRTAERKREVRAEE